MLVEGFKAEVHDKIEVFRSSNGKPPLHPDDARIRIIASDTPFPDAGRPVVQLDDIDAIAIHVLAVAEPIEKLIARLRQVHVDPAPESDKG